MIPIRSTSTKENCSPMSSNCIIWQGLDIPCLSLCKGDSISDVTYKLALEVCNLIDNVGISNVNLTQLAAIDVGPCSVTPVPTITLTNVLNLIIDKVVCVAQAVEDIPAVIPYVPPTFSTIQYSCLVSVGGIAVNDESLDNFINLIASNLCDLNEQVSDLSGQVTLNANQIITIQNTYFNELSDLGQYTNCYTKTVGTIDVILNEVTQTICDYAEVLGTPTDLDPVITAQCAGLSTEKQLSGNTTFPMSAITTNGGWRSTVVTVADSLQNLWLTVCDMRAAIKLIQENCCKVSCEDIVVDFDYKWVVDPDDAKIVTLVLFFFPKTNVPNGFYDCGDNGAQNSGGPGQVFTFTDGAGREYVLSPGIHFRYKDPTMITGAVMTDIDIIQNGYSISFDSTSVDITTGLTVTSNVCFTDGTNNCIKCVNKVITPYVPPKVETDTCCTITATQNTTIVYCINDTPAL